MIIRFAVVGLSHNHIYGMTQQLLQEGAELVWLHDTQPQRISEFSQQYSQAELARSIDEILEDKSIHLIASAIDPDQRAGLGIRVMQQGKDFLCAKPGFTTLEQLAQVKQVQSQTQHKYAVYFSERLANKATIKAGELVHDGAIGHVIQTVGFGPHQLGQRTRPEWTYLREQHGGILNDLASHQIDQFLHFTGSTDASIVAAHIGNFNHPQYPKMDDFGDLTLRSDHATGYCRVDWLTPQGLGTWGDVRLFILGTTGTIEIRKNCDLGRSISSNHLFLVDQQQTKVIDCSDVGLPYASQLIGDILNRTEIAMTQSHCFLTSELALMAEAQAHRLYSS